MWALTWGISAVLVASGPVQLASPGLAGVNVEPERVMFFSDHLAQQLTLQGDVRCITASELQTVLGLERQKALIGCEESSSCLAELANALGADGIVTGSVAQFGSSFQANVKIVGATSAQTLAVFSGKAESESELLELLTLAARRMALSAKVALKRISVPEALSLREEVLDRERSENGALRSRAWIPAAAGGVLAAAGGVLFFQARQSAAALSGGDGPGGAPPEASLTPDRAASLRDSGERNQLLGVAGLSLGVAGLATGAIFYLFGAGDPHEAPWTFAVGPASASLGGRF